MGLSCKRYNRFKNWPGGEFRLIVGSHLHFTKLIVLGWVGGSEMWELRIRWSNRGGYVKDKICLRIGPGGKEFRLIVGSHLHFKILIVLGWVGGGEMWELRIRCSNCGWMYKRQNMFQNWSREGARGHGQGKNRYF